MFMRDRRLQTTPCFGELTLSISGEYKDSGSWISLAEGIRSESNAFPEVIEYRKIKNG
jgi:hypothetical protein